MPLTIPRLLRVVRCIRRRQVHPTGLLAPIPPPLHNTFTNNRFSRVVRLSVPHHTPPVTRVPRIHLLIKYEINTRRHSPNCPYEKRTQCTFLPSMDAIRFLVSITVTASKFVSTQRHPPYGHLPWESSPVGVKSPSEHANCGATSVASTCGEPLTKCVTASPVNKNTTSSY